MSPSNYSFLESLQRLRERLWGKDVISYVHEGDKSYAIVDLTLFADLPQNSSSDNILLIRQEYILAYDAILRGIENTKRAHGSGSAFLVTGQSGIGKTLFLLYLLVRRLQERESVAFQLDAKTFALFDKDGVTLHVSSLNSAFVIPKDAWVLSDSGAGNELPCGAFTRRRTHIVHASVPASRYWRSWVEHNSAQRYVMDVWSVDELRTLLTINNLDVRRGVTLFEKFGPSPRIIIDLLKFPDQEAIYLADINAAAHDISCNLSKMFSDLRRLDFSANMSAEIIIMVRPETLQTRLPNLYIPTPFLVNILGIAIARYPAAQQHSFFTLLEAYPPLCGTARWLFEHYANVCFSRPNNNIPFQGYLRGNPHPHQIPSTPSSATITGSTALKTIQPPFNFYWRPRAREPDFDGVHALIRCNNVVWVLQFVIYAPCDTPSRGLDKVFEVMNHNTAGVEWRLVIVGPDREVAEFAQYHQILTGFWARMPVYACELPLGRFTDDDVQQLWDNMNEANEICPTMNQYGKPDCQASKSVAKHLAAINAEAG